MAYQIEGCGRHGDWDAEYAGDGGENYFTSREEAEKFIPKLCATEGMNSSPADWRVVEIEDRDE